MLVVAAGAAGYFTGWIRTDATSVADKRYADKQQIDFQTAVKEDFAALRARTDQVDRDRESGRNTINKAMADQGEALRGQIDALRGRMEQQIGDLGQRVGNTEIRVCVLSGLKVSQCK